MQKTKTQVGIIGAGPSGLLLAQMLHNRGIESVILESRDRPYVRARLRAGVLEQNTVDALIKEGVGEKLQKNCMTHKGIYIHFNQEAHYLNVEELTGGKVVTVYGQRQITCDMIDIREQNGLPLFFEAKAQKINHLKEEQSHIYYTHEGEEKVLECDFVAGCDGFHGISRKHIPSSIQENFTRTFPYAWFGVLAEAPPACHEVIYAHSPEGFALQSMRGPNLSRLYIQTPNKEDINAWTEDAFFDEFEKRIGAGYKVNRGKIINRGLAPMRSFVSEPMRYGNLFLAGDAAHIVPPTGAKGMNLSIADVTVLGNAFERFYKNKNTDLLDRYSEICLRRIWKVERFSWWVTTSTHKDPRQSRFEEKMQIATLSYLVDSKVGGHSFAENYVGLPYSF